jgi:hypothetical protein
MHAIASQCRLSKLQFSSLLTIAVFIGSASILAAEIDQDSGLIIDEGWEIIKNTCGNCHSLSLVTSQRADRRSWLDTIRWMQANQNLQQFDIDTENAILDYLAKNYPPLEHKRRMPLPPQFLPVTP